MIHQGEIKENEKTLIAYGDSWTFGAELVEPDYDVDKLGYPKDATEIKFRKDNVLPTVLSNKLGFDNCINYGVCGGSNDGIFDKISNLVYGEYVCKNRSTENLFILIGFTEPIRRDFYVEDTITPFTLSHNYNTIFDEIDGFKKFYEFYVTNLMIKKEYINRYLQEIIYIENLLNNHKIKFLMFQGFYGDVRKDSIGVTNLLEFVNDKTFYGIKTDETFKSFLDKKNDTSLFAPCFHPSAQGHHLFAEELYNHIIKNGLI
jgi:hypothetical protein